MSEMNGEFPTILGPDARFKGEISFDKGLRVLGQFEGQIRSKGTLHVAEGARIQAQIEAANIRVDGEVKGNVVATEKLHLSATCKIDGDLKAARLEMNDGAQFVGHVAIGAIGENTQRREQQMPPGSVRPVEGGPQAMPKLRPPPEPSAIPIPGVPVGR